MKFSTRIGLAIASHALHTTAAVIQSRLPSLETAGAHCSLTIDTILDYRKVLSPHVNIILYDEQNAQVNAWAGEMSFAQEEVFAGPGAVDVVWRLVPAEDGAEETGWPLDVAFRYGKERWRASECALRTSTGTGLGATMAAELRVCTFSCLR